MVFLLALCIQEISHHGTIIETAQHSPPPLQISFKFAYLTDPFVIMLHAQFHLQISLPNSLWLMNNNKSNLWILQNFQLDRISL